ncbi:hypothetical protein M409DRAFT_16534 [Zasmidium cellare ATCC 36951]|uniref:Complex I intermediate-associated protein 84, mitochondrial n=1 Tax=Zasmidium cellare ATCC 36951 TaxID=1080233 RepID=A0A6A6D7I3_ZASCE|nr:uncharacterized protein M409DRAFT_16534 [Zasmidium cellare ATCC 36951]KAF2174270.1 hypothetical protein M409DRAFT_16534 [Zasmidium cellare ATCC 36951]
MSSSLTRRVFRSILANEPIVHRGCLRRRHYGTTRRLQLAPSRPAACNGGIKPIQQRRTLFGMFGGGKKNDAQDADIDPGVEKMMEYVKMQKMSARLPPPSEVVEALSQFFNHKYKYKNRGSQQPIEDTQAELAAKSLQYCLDSIKPVHSDGPKTVVPFKALEKGRRALRRTVSPTPSHVHLAYLIYQAFSNTSPVRRLLAAVTYVSCLASSGRVQEARQFVLDLQVPDDTAAPSSKPSDEDDLPSSEFVDETVNPPTSSQSVSALWSEVLRGFARQDSESALLETLDMARTHVSGAISQLPTHMLDFYLRKDDHDKVKSWFVEYWQASGEDIASDQSKSQRADMVGKVLRWCLQHDQIDFGHDVVRQALSETPSKGIWDAVFVWAAGTGKGADEIDRMFTVMESANKKIADPTNWNTPNTATINALVEYATSKNDPYLAERFIAIGKARDIHPDANTYVLQMKYRLKISDVDGALIAYKNLQSMDLSSNHDVPTVNELIAALCKSSRHDFDTIMNVAADLSDRKARFEPATATALSLLHLNRDEVHDVTDLMNTHAFHYSTAEREVVRRDLVAYCLDPKTPLSRVWDAYNVLIEIFDEMARDERTQIMLVFFRRERPDVSVNIFNTMRSHYREDTIPSIDTYVAAFLASAKLRDLDSLEVIHNQLKLDYNIDANTYLLNALMIGYSACGNPRRALTFWDDIVASKEGPTYNSIHIALRACEKAPFGDLRAEKIWAKLRSMNIDLDQELWASYIAALAGNGNTEKAISTLEEAESKGELEVDAFLVGSLFNGCSGQAPQEEVESWSKERFPQIWEELEKGGVDEDENGMRTLRIDRTVTP